MSDFSRLENEDENAYIWRVCENKSLIGSWDDVRDILNKELAYEYTESWYRKNYQSFCKMFDAVKDKYLDNEIILEIEAKKQELYKERCKLSDQRTALNKKLREDSRLEVRLDKLESELKEAGKNVCNNTFDINLESQGDKDLFVMLSDLHIGQSFDSQYGKYNIGVARDRLEQYANKVVSIAQHHNAQECFLSLQGDLISNSIHKTLAITNQENVIEQVKLASQMITNFILAISPYFKKIHVASVSGNHSRMDRKEDALKDERLDDLIYWFIKTFLSHAESILFQENKDNTYSEFDIRGKKYINIHGDYDSYSKKGVQDLSFMLGFIPDVVTYGHMHTCAMSTESNVKIIRGGAFAGSGDDYTVTNRLVGKPAQMVCVCDSKGISACYPVELD